MQDRKAPRSMKFSCNCPIIKAANIKAE